VLQGHDIHIRRFLKLKHSSAVLPAIGLVFLIVSAIGAVAQSVQPRQDRPAGNAVIPDAPVPARQPEDASTRPSSGISLGPSSLVEAPNAPQDQQNPPQSGQPADTIQKPIPQNSAPTRDPQTKRILGIVPNFRSVSTDEKLPPMSVKEKFLTATDDSFDYSSIFVPAMLSGISLARKSTPEFGEGAVGFGRYFWHSAVDQTSENYMVEFVFPVVTREDNRYYTLGSGGFFKRTRYALSRAVITRNDAGNETFNISEVLGAGASSGLSNLYYPSRERTFGNTGSQWGIDIGVDAASFVIKEFWPDINRKFFHESDPIEGAKHQ
jgi:hypothetical protein